MRAQLPAATAHPWLTQTSTQATPSPLMGVTSRIIGGGGLTAKLKTPPDLPPKTAPTHTFFSLHCRVLFSKLQECESRHLVLREKKAFKKEEGS